MAAIASLSFPALGQSDKISNFAPARPLGSVSVVCRRFSRRSLTSSRASTSSSRSIIHCMSSVTDVPPVSETKSNFLKAYKRPIPSIYNTVLQELIVQQHLMRYKRTYRYDPVFALGFVTVYDQLMEGYPSDQDRDAIFKAYVEALNEDPKQYRIDAQKIEEWARTQTSASLVDFSTRDGEVEALLKDIAGRAGSKEGFSYSRFFAVGLFRLLELAGATDPTVLDKLCASLNINKKSVDRDLDVYRNLLSKLVQAKELLKEYVEREKKKRGERAESQKTNETISKCMGDSLYIPSFLVERKP
uniref:Protein THYLAKOID FORMATION 1, chloroplastic n=1 Tax=Noccaea caerulescens TaxID=107243 RepID=A0A1J3J9G0_NOCCA